MSGMTQYKQILEDVTIASESISVLENDFYETFKKVSQGLVDNENMNKAKGITVAAIESRELGENPNKNVREKIDRLCEIDLEITQKSTYIRNYYNDDIVPRFEKLIEDVNNEIKNLLDDIEDGSISASKIMEKYKAGVEVDFYAIQDNVADGFPKEIDKILNSFSDGICEEVGSLKKVIDEKDDLVFSTPTRSKPWTEGLLIDNIPSSRGNNTGGSGYWAGKINNLTPGS